MPNPNPIPNPSVAPVEADPEHHARSLTFPPPLPSATATPIEPSASASFLPSSDPPGHRSGYLAIVGRPNAGKSTLMNCLLGQKLSIVTAKAQTTRHRILGILSDPLYQIVMLDTPGVINKAGSGMERRMITAVKNAIQDADAVLAIIDASDRPEEAVEMLAPGAAWQGPPLCLVLNKIDLLPSEAEVETLMGWVREASGASVVLPISAKDVKGIDRLKDWMVQAMPEGPTLYDKEYVAQASERFFVAEIVREKIFEQYRQEIPYCCQVECVEFKESRGAKDYVKLDILVEKESQKGVLLGAKGSALKRLSTASRVDIEGFLGRPVYLEITVKHAKGWRDDNSLLDKFGY